MRPYDWSLANTVFNVEASKLEHEPPQTSMPRKEGQGAYLFQPQGSLLYHSTTSPQSLSTCSPESMQKNRPKHKQEKSDVILQTFELGFTAALRKRRGPLWVPASMAKKALRSSGSRPRHREPVAWGAELRRAPGSRLFLSAEAWLGGEGGRDVGGLEFGAHTVVSTNLSIHLRICPSIHVSIYLSICSFLFFCECLRKLP